MGLTSLNENRIVPLSTQWAGASLSALDGSLAPAPLPCEIMWIMGAEMDVPGVGFGCGCGRVRDGVLFRAIDYICDRLNTIEI